jgi:hypothetical protein
MLAFEHDFEEPRGFNDFPSGLRYLASLDNNFDIPVSFDPGQMMHVYV